MSNLAVSRVGQINAAGAADALFLKVFAGEVIAVFVAENIMMPLHTVRTISSGKSASFPVIGAATAAYHTPGNEIDGQAVKANEKIVVIDSLLTSAVGIANIDDAMNHYDVRSQYTFNVGSALAIQADKNILQCTVLAARATATITGGDGGSALTAATMKTDADVLRNKIIDAAQTLDDKKVPQNDRHCVLPPAQFWLMVKDTDAMNIQWRGSGSLAEGTLPRIAGVDIHKSVNFPITNIAAVSGENNTYSGDFTKTAAVVFHRSATASVKLLDLAVESEYLVRNQSTLIVAKYAMGHNILRPESSVELATP